MSEDLFDGEMQDDLFGMTEDTAEDLFPDFNPPNPKHEEENNEGSKENKEQEV